MPVSLNPISCFQNLISSVSALNTLAKHLPDLESVNRWAVKVRDFRDNHTGPVALISTTALVTTCVLGRQTAQVFSAFAAVTYPLSHKHIQDFMRLDKHGIIQDISSIAIPILCGTIPTTALILLPFHLTTILSKKMCEWVQTQEMQKNASQIENLSEETANTRLECEKITKKLEESKQVVAQSKKEIADLSEKLLNFSNTQSARESSLQNEKNDLIKTNEKTKEKLSQINYLLEESRKIAKLREEKIEQISTAFSEQTAAFARQTEELKKQTAEHEETMDLVKQVFAKYGIPFHMQEDEPNTTEKL